MSPTTTEQVVKLLRERFGPCADACVQCEAIALDAVIAAVQQYQLHGNPPHGCCVGDRRTGHAFDCRPTTRSERTLTAAEANAMFDALADRPARFQLAARKQAC